LRSSSLNGQCASAALQTSGTLRAEPATTRDRMIKIKLLVGWASVSSKPHEDCQRVSVAAAFGGCRGRMALGPGVLLAVAIVSHQRDSRSANPKSSLDARLLRGFALYRRDAHVRLRPSVRRLVALLAVQGVEDRSDASARLFDDLLLQARSKLAHDLVEVARRLPRAGVEAGGSLATTGSDTDNHQLAHWSLAVIHRSSDIPVMPTVAGKDLLPSWGDPWLIEPREHLHCCKSTPWKRRRKDSLSQDASVKR
jgi:hypothetical protein